MMIMMRKNAMPVPFEDKTVKYKMYDRVAKKWLTGSTNKHTWQFMKNKYVVFRDFLPKEMIQMSMDMWKTDELGEGFYTKQENRDITYKNPMSSIGKSKGGYCTPWGVALHGFIHNKLKDYIDMDLRETYSYTRKYERGAYLGTHTDRPSCEVSATLCLDYQTDDNTPWKIWVRNDKNYAGVDAEIIKNESQDLPQRLREKYSCHSVSLEPGDILLYQGPNIPHWRDYLLGEYSYHLFVHFFNADSKMIDLDGFVVGKNHDVNTAHERYALDLDGREHRWSRDNVSQTQKTIDFNKFSELYYASDYSDKVNFYDDLELVENK